MKNKVIILGPLPPPVMGPSLATGIILNSDLKNHIHLIHCDTSDHRELTTLGRIDLMNFYLAFKHYLKLFGLIIRYRPKMVYIPISQTTMGYFRDAGFILIAKLFRRKVVCHLRGGNFMKWLAASSTLTRWLIIRIQKKVDGQIVLGESLRALFSPILLPERIYVVPNGGNYPVTKHTESDGVVKIIFLSNLLPEKGIEDSIKAMALLPTLNVQIPFQLIVYGSWRDTETRTSAFRLIREQSLPIYFHRSIGGTAKMKALADADIFVFPSYYPPEGHPWVIVEAMAAGLPIISTDQGAITESVIDGVNGFIVEKRNPAQIAEKIKYLVENEEARKMMGQASHRMYEENFTEERMVERLSAAFQKVMEG